MPTVDGARLAELERIKAELERRAGSRTPKAFIPHAPHPKQREFLQLKSREALYGGAAGGGKSDALLMAALQYVHIPGYSAILFRRTYQDLNLPGAIMSRSHEWLAGTGAKWNGTDKRWSFPSGAHLSFGYLDTDRDRYRYASAEFQFIGFDELTQFPEQWYRFLFSRLRKRHGVDVPLRMRAATNPGGIGHEWVRRRFIATPTDERPFVAAKIVDNPSLDAGSYLESLAQLDAGTRAQLEHGLWVRDTDGLVYHYDEGRNAVGEAPECPHKVLALDFGATAPTAFTVLGWRDHDPTVYVLRSWKVAGLAPSEAAEKVHELESAHGFEAIVGDIGGLGKGYQLEMRRRFHAPIEAADKNNKLGYVSLFNGDLERGKVKVVREHCSSLVDEWSELPWNDGRTKEQGGFDNHCADATLYGWRKCMAFVERPEAPKPTLDQRYRFEESNLEELADEEWERKQRLEWWEQ